MARPPARSSVLPEAGLDAVLAAGAARTAIAALTRWARARRIAGRGAGRGRSWAGVDAERAPTAIDGEARMLGTGSAGLHTFAGPLEVVRVALATAVRKRLALARLRVEEPAPERAVARARIRRQEAATGARSAAGASRAARRSTARASPTAARGRAPARARCPGGAAATVVLGRAAAAPDQQQNQRNRPHPNSVPPNRFPVNVRHSPSVARRNQACFSSSTMICVNRSALSTSLCSSATLRASRTPTR